MRKLTTEEWIKKATKIHNGKYDYSRAVYLGSGKMIEIGCPIHGFRMQKANSHLSTGGCNLCGIEETSKKVLEHGLQKFLNKVQHLFKGRYDYSLVEYKGSRVEVDILCIEHQHIFKQTPMSHSQGSVGCKFCQGVDVYSTETFIEKGRKIHGVKFGYTNVVYIDSVTEVDVYCPIHGIVPITPNSHLNSKFGCPHCHKESKFGETNPNYKDGKSANRKAERNTPENYKWRNAVAKDKTNCDCCDTPFSEEVGLERHHLNSWLGFPNERYDVNNGVAICEDCHWEFHTQYGNGFNTKEQYHQFKQLKQIDM